MADPHDIDACLSEMEGGPAFPQKEPLTCDWHGMTLRDYFAAKAMQAALVNAKLPGLIDNDPGAIAVMDRAAKGFYLIADAMLKARSAR